MLTAPLAAGSTKAYFGAERTLRWVADIVERAPRAAAGGIELAVLPSFPLLDAVGRLVAGTPVRLGAQDVAPRDDGAQTGEVTAALLAELGCRYVEVGHAERRAAGEDDETVRAKAARVAAHGMVPLVCVGESRHTSASEAATACVAQLRDALGGVPDQSEVVVAYEPVWAIEAPRPAPAGHVAGVAAALRSVLAQRRGGGRVLYGGAAGPGTAASLGRAVDGLFLGRFAHDAAAFEAVADELTAVWSVDPAPVNPGPGPRDPDKKNEV